MRDIKSFDDRGEHSGTFDASAVASLFERAGVGYDRAEDRPFSRVPPAPVGEPDTLRPGDEGELPSADTEVDYLELPVPPGFDREPRFSQDEIDTAIVERHSLLPE